MPSTVHTTARDLGQRVAHHLRDPHWDVHRVVEDALLALQQGQPVDTALAWLDALSPQAGRVRDSQGRGLGLPLCHHPVQKFPELAILLLDALVRRGLDVNAPLIAPKNSLDDVQTMLQAVNEGGLNGPMTLRLLDHGAAPGTWIGGCTLMHLAVADDEGLEDPPAPSFIPALAQRGVPLDQASHHGATPLMTALNLRDRAIAHRAFSALLAAGANPNTLSSDDIGTPLHAATMRGDLEMVDALLNAGAEPDVPNVKGETPLIKAVAHTPLHNDQPMPRARLAQRLIAAGANVNACDTSGDTVAARAAGVRTLDKDVLELLAQHGADMETRSTRGHSARSRLENRASRNGEITPAEVQVLVDTAAVHRALIDVGEDGLPAVATSRSRSRL